MLGARNQRCQVSGNTLQACYGFSGVRGLWTSAGSVQVREPVSLSSLTARDSSRPCAREGRDGSCLQGVIVMVPEKYIRRPALCVTESSVMLVNGVLGSVPQGPGEANLLKTKDEIKTSVRLSQVCLQSWP